MQWVTFKKQIVLSFYANMMSLVFTFSLEIQWVAHIPKIYFFLQKACMNNVFAL
jgi:hypothetical protein